MFSGLSVWIQPKTPDYMQLVTNQIFHSASATAILFSVFETLLKVWFCSLFAFIRTHTSRNYFFPSTTQNTKFQLAFRASQSMSCDVV